MPARSGGRFGRCLTQGASRRGVRGLTPIIPANAVARMRLHTEYLLDDSVAWSAAG